MWDCGNQIQYLILKKTRTLKAPKTMFGILHREDSSLKATFLVLLHLMHLVEAYKFIYAGCSQEKFDPSSPFESNLNSFFSSAVNSASQSLFNSIALGNGTAAYPEAAVYGLYQCRGDLKASDCGICIQSLVSQIGLVCPYSYGASLQLDSCYLRYEHIDFLGALDTSLMYNRCSQGVSNDVEFFRRRDDVLADLQGANGFRVSTSGLVQGFAQCMGDLNRGNCSTCLSVAVSQLKNLCGSAVAAQVFLAKCFALYWDAGFYDLDSGTDSSNGDDVGRTVSIIVAVVGCLAVVIVLLSVCRKAMG